MNPMNIFTLLVQLGKQIGNQQLDIPALTDGMDYAKCQEELYHLQEFGLRVVANWDVLKKIYRNSYELTPCEEGTPKDATSPFDFFLKTMFERFIQHIPALFDNNDIFNMDIMVKLRESLRNLYESYKEVAVPNS